MRDIVASATNVQFDFLLQLGGRNSEHSPVSYLAVVFDATEVPRVSRPKVNLFKGSVHV